ncbi:MAG: hypothetical protein EBZ61_09070 [Micrococcales bacterium]|nr:hypothetical protein [Micrococcales bacterium]
MSKFTDAIEKAMRILAEELEDSDSQICTGWVLVSEWSDYEGTRYLMTDVSENMNPWLAKGMLLSAEEYSYNPEEEKDGNSGK